MSLRNRFLLVGLGIIIFLILTPMLVLYARGFKYDFQTRKIVKTGALVVRSQPQEASVFLDSKIQKRQTPITIRFLIPKDYDVRIEKNGYLPWSKRLSIQQQLVTWANHNREFVTLFLEEPKLIDKIKTNLVSQSSALNSLAFLQNKKLNILNFNNATTTLLGEFNLNTDLANRIFWTNPEKIYQVFSQIKSVKISETQLKNIKKIESNGDYTVILIADQLYIYDIASGLVLIEDRVIDFDLTFNNAWYLQNQAIKRFNLSNKALEIIKAGLPDFKQGKITRDSEFLFLLLDQALYQVSNDLERVYNNVSEFRFDYAANKLIISNTNEVVIFDPLKQEAELVLRSISPIKNPVSNIETGYMFFQNEGKIKAIELDGRDLRNVYTIADTLDNFALNEDGRLLYVYSQEEIKIYAIR